MVTKLTQDVRYETPVKLTLYGIELYAAIW